MSLVGAHLRHATCIVSQFHLNDGSLFHSEQVAPCAIVVTGHTHGGKAIISVGKTSQTHLHVLWLIYQIVSPHKAIMVCPINALRKSAVVMVV